MLQPLPDMGTFAQCERRVSSLTLNLGHAPDPYSSHSCRPAPLLPPALPLEVDFGVIRDNLKLLPAIKLKVVSSLDFEEAKDLLEHAGVIGSLM